jgi:hypothetical protein
VLATGGLMSLVYGLAKVNDDDYSTGPKTRSSWSPLLLLGCSWSGSAGQRAAAAVPHLQEPQRARAPTSACCSSAPASSRSSSS